jgi:hypothetical protein
MYTLTLDASRYVDRITTALIVFAIRSPGWLRMIVRERSAGT